MKKGKIKDSIIITLAGLFFIGIGVFTDYTLTFAGITFPQWSSIALGTVVIVGWYILINMPEKDEKDKDK